MDTQTAVTQITDAATKIQAHTVTFAELAAQMADLAAKMQAIQVELDALRAGPKTDPDVMAAVSALTLAVTKADEVINPAPQPPAPPPPSGQTQVWRWDYQGGFSEGKQFSIDGAPRYVRFGWGGTRWVIKLVQGACTSSVAFFDADTLIGVPKSAQIYRPANDDGTATTPIPLSTSEELLTAYPAGSRWQVVAKQGDTAVFEGGGRYLYGVENDPFRQILVAIPPGSWVVNNSITNGDPAISNPNKVMMKIIAG